MSVQEKISQEQSEQAQAAMAARVAAAQAASGGRKPMLDPAAQRALEAQRMAEEGQAATEPPVRPRGARKPFGAQEQTLSWPLVPGYRLYWFNDTPGRIERAIEAGYDHVRHSATGNPVKHMVGRGERGEGLQSFLMQIPEDWYTEDRDAAQRAESEKLRNIQAGQTGNPNQYVPSQGIKMERR